MSSLWTSSRVVTLHTRRGYSSASHRPDIASRKQPLAWHAGNASLISAFYCACADGRNSWPIVR